MKIAHIVHHFLPESNAGCENYVYRLAAAQAAEGHTVHVYTRALWQYSPEPAIVRESLDELTVVRFTHAVLYMDDWYRLRSEPVEQMLRTELADFQPDIVHVHHWIALTLSVVAICRRLALKTVVTLHDLFVSCPTGHRMHVDGHLCLKPAQIDTCYRCLCHAGANPNKPVGDRRQLEQMLQLRQSTLLSELEMADGIIAAASSFVDFLATYVEFDRSKVTIIPKFATAHMEIEPFAGPKPDDRFHIVFFGSVNPFKAPHLLLQAVQRLPDDLRPQVKVWLYGYAYFVDYERRLRALARGLDVEIAQEIFHPSQIAARHFDLCVLPSRHYESFSFTTSEAILLELPLIVSDQGVPATRIDGCGLTFRYGDSRDLAVQISRMMREPELRTACRRQCRRLKQRFKTPAEHAAELLAYYRTII